MTDLRQAAQDVIAQSRHHNPDAMYQKIKALEAALAAPQPEPVAFMWQHSETGCINFLPPDHFLDTGAKWFCVGPVYLPPPQRQPLTDEEIKEIASTPAAIPGSYVHAFARAIEKATRGDQ